MPVAIPMLASMYATLHVIDKGPGFQNVPRLPADPLSERGRGLYLINRASREFTVMPAAGGGSHAIAALPILTDVR